MKAIVSFYVDCGRMGSLDGMFTCDKEQLEKSYGKAVYFGEVLGKHSEISVDLKEGHFTIKSDDQEFIAKFEEIIGSGTISGFNPFDYMDEDDESADPDEDED